MTVEWLSLLLTALAISIGHLHAEDCLPPIITDQPADLVGTGYFCVRATGDSPLSYQWLFNGSRIGNATNRCYYTGTQGTPWPHVGIYSVVISNCAGAVTSALAHLDIHGLLARYVPDNPELTVQSRIDPNIDFDWSGRPFDGFPGNNFSVTWRGEIEARESGPHSFYVIGLDDGARLWVNGVRLLDDWYQHAPFSWYTRTVELEAGRRYPIAVDYFEATGGASITLAWSGPTHPYEVIPSSQFWVAAASSNHPPNEPMIVYPARSGDSLPGLELIAAVDFFSDFDGNGSYRFTDWEIWSINPIERIWARTGTNSTSLTQVGLGEGQFENSHAGRTNLAPGTFYQLRVRHIDQQLAASPWVARNFNTLTPQPLVGIGTTWSYLDGGTTPGPGWSGTNFDDSAWAAGFPMFGYRGAATSTILDYGLHALNKPVSYFLRTRFQLPHPETIERLQFRLLLSEGAVVYLNGQEVLRNNMPAGEITPSTLALAAVPSGPNARMFLYEHDASPLVTNENVLSVEVHLSSPEATRLRFYLELTALTKTGEKLPVLVESNFRTGAEGWQVERIGSTALIPVFNPNNGNGDGFLSNYEPGDGTQRYWKAPGKFLGDQSASYGGFLKFDLKESILDGDYHFDDVVLEGRAGRLVFKTPYNPDYFWTHYSIPLRENTGWHWNNSDGLTATSTDLISVLASLTNLLIGGEYFSGPDTCALDNARLVGNTNSPLQAPIIIAQPRTANLLEGSSIAFVIAATGSLPLSYEWFHNVVRRPTTNFNWIASSSVRPTDGGSYRVRVSNAFGEDWSEEWSLNVTPDTLVFTEQPSNRTVEVGGSVTFRVAIDSGSTPGYRWQRRTGTNQFLTVSALDAPVYTIPFAPTNAIGDYRVIVTNRFHSVTSQIATLTVIPDLVTPRLVSAMLPVNTTNIVQFAVSEAMLSTSARGTNQYLIIDNCSGHASFPTSVSTSGSLGQLRTVSALDRRRSYSLMVNGITDASSNLVAANSRVLVGVATNVTLLRSSDPWWWNESDHDLGTGWRNQLDLSLFSGCGSGLFYRDPDILPSCLGTPGTGIGLGPRTYYFWNTFVARPIPRNGTLQLRLIADDGAVVYLNGTEAYRLNMPAGTVSHATWAATTIANPAQCVTVNLPTTNLLVGTNLITVEVHQANAGSEDVLFGMELTQTAIDFPAPFICSPTIANANLTLTVSAVPGDIFHLEASTNLINWEIVSSTNAIGNDLQFEIPDPTRFAQRYFRVRLEP